MHHDTLDSQQSFSDDAHALRYVLHSVQGSSPVSGGTFGEALDADYVEGDEFDIEVL